MNPPQEPAATAADARQASIVKCPACGASITLRALGQSVMVACSFCRTQLDVSRPDIQIIRKYRDTAQKLRIPLGTRGLVKGQTFEVIGAMERKVSGYKWQEYLLFNPYLGFRWLVFDSGHWSFGRMLKESLASPGSDSFSYEGRTYRKFQEGKPAVEWVIGEFYWRVEVGDRVRSTDYIAPPFMLSLEKSETERTWTLLEYIEPAQIETAFGIVSPPRHSVAPNQPNADAPDLRRVLRLGFAALALAVLIQGITVARARSSYQSVGTYSFFADRPEQVFGPFTFDAPFSLNELTADAAIDNAWVELNCTLVNAATGEEHEFTDAFSYYHGYDSDGAWSEGNTRHTSLVAQIPAGTYNLLVEGAGGDDQGRRLSQGVYLRMTQDVVPWQNFWIALLGILAYPGYLIYRSYRFEKERWAQSDFNPYASDSD